jgi:CheY-like chemotaxis protein
MTHGDILIIDDAPAVLATLEELLQKEGYTTRSASDGPAALSALQAARPDLVLLDFHLIGMTGLQLLTAAQDRTMATPPLLPAIVLVDDDPSVRLILSLALTHIADGYELVAVEDGAAALDVLRTRPIVLLITDYNMPTMNGLELIQAVKVDWPSTMVVMITAYVTPELARQAIAAGADYYLPKPFPFDQLEAIVKAALAETG